MRLLLRVVVTALFVSGLSAIGSIASAVTSVDVLASNASVIGGKCDWAKIRVFGDWDADPYNDITVNVLNPGGREVDSIYSENNYRGRVITYVRLCGRQDRPGTYKVNVFVRGYDENHELASRARDSVTFEFKKTPILNSTVRRDVDYRPHKRVYKYVVIGRLLRAQKGWRGQRVELQAYIRGAGWLVIDTQRSRRRGLFGWEFKPNRYVWAYVYQGNRTTRWDSSPNFRTPRRVGARETASAHVSGADDPSQLVTRLR
ncbi:hypothetical protein [Nocardioides pelophilus]|uniref:hypothetical protein n=1 Tax=Nocardioides pelophilus TaxID=2172019 RepID=UPI0016034799|nr:hypothetical protein [Nocardioides pelophilus]